MDHQNFCHNALYQNSCPGGLGHFGPYPKLPFKFWTFLHANAMFLDSELFCYIGITTRIKRLGQLEPPFGWHQAPGLVQHLIATVIAQVDPGGVVVVKYLDDILVVGRQKLEVHRVTDDVTAALRDARFLIGAESILTPVAEVTWMGKMVNAHVGRI